MRNILILTPLAGFRPGIIPAREIIAASALSFGDIKALAELKAIEPTDFAVTVVIEDGAWSRIDALLPLEFLEASGGVAVDPPIEPMSPVAQELTQIAADLANDVGQPVVSIGLRSEGQSATIADADSVVAQPPVEQPTADQMRDAPHPVEQAGVARPAPTTPAPVAKPKRTKAS